MWPWADLLGASAQAAAEDCAVTVVPWHDWEYAGHGTTQGRLAGTIIHDTVSPYSWSDAQLLRLLRQGYTGLPGPIANVGVGPTGNLLLVAAGTAWHAGSGRWPGIPSGNLNTVGIEVSNDGRQPWRPIQVQVVRRFVLHLHRAAGLEPDTHIGHKEWAPSRKRDPHSVKLPIERALLREALTEPDPEPEDPMADYGDELEAIARNTRQTADDTDRSVRLQAALLEDAVARYRAQLGLPPSPESDGIWSSRIALGTHTLTDVKERLDAALKERQ